MLEACGRVGGATLLEWIPGGSKPVSPNGTKFCFLPESVCTIFQQPAHEKDRERLQQLAIIIQGASRGI